MSKLFQFKRWLTVPEAAGRLSSSFDENVTEADVLRLALDGHLTLSIDFPNKAKARRMVKLSKERAALNYFESCFLEDVLAHDDLSLSALQILDDFKKHLVDTGIAKTSFGEMELPGELPEYFEFKEVVTIEGVFDLPMIGAEALDVHHRLMMLSGGPEITLQCLDGAFVTDGSGEHYQLQDRFSDIPSDEIPSFERPMPFSERDYYPAGALPDDALWGVRTEALLDLERRILRGEETDSPAGKSQTKPLINEERWFDVLGVMAILLYENTDDPRMRKGENNINMAGIKGAVIDKAQKLGLSAERLENLNKDISAALKILQYPPPKN